MPVVAFVPRPRVDSIAPGSGEMFSILRTPVTLCCVRIFGWGRCMLLLHCYLSCDKWPVYGGMCYELGQPKNVFFSEALLVAPPHFRKGI